MQLGTAVGDLIAQQDTGIIVHGCNALGVMGSGIARTVRDTYPQAYKDYREFCKGKSAAALLGKIQVTHINDNLIIVNAITQDDYGTDTRKVNYEAVARCFEALAKLIDDGRLDLYDYTVNYPKIGAGLGGGNWDAIQALISSELDPLLIQHRLWLLP